MNESLKKLPARFIFWKLMPKDGGFAKVPVNVNGYPIDPHLPTNWMGLEQAQGVIETVPDLNLGWVIAGDGYFFIDLDDCRDESDWNAHAKTVCSYFPGAMMEVSQSGKGLHIIGWCHVDKVRDRKNKWKTDGKTSEFYIEKRFIAFGPHGWQGDPYQDFTSAVLSVVPQRDPGDDNALTDGPSPEYTGPTDDNELIAKMLSATGSMNSVFKSKASFRDLWEGFAPHLIQFFPSPTNPNDYDHSSADAALMAHLAFWTGRDGERMDRLFRRSKLYREKYENRADYRNGTIINAVRNCKKVYDIPRKAEPPIQGGVVSQVTGEHVASQILDTFGQIEHFKGCTYVLDLHRVMMDDGYMATPERFKAWKGGYEFVVDNEGRPTKNAFEAFTESRVYRFPRVKSTVFRPDLPPAHIDEVASTVNTYIPYHCRRVKGDPSPILNFLHKLLPNPRDREILLAYMASMVQNPGKKFQWAPVLQGTQGNGKTMLMTCIQHIVGGKYTHSPAAGDLDSAFNSFLEAKLFIAVEEIHMDGRREILDLLKPLITNERIEVQAKGVDKRMVDNCANWIFCTNYKDAVLTNKDDRRYAIFFTAQQTADDLVRDGMNGDYFPRLWNWLKYEDGFAIVAEYLLTYNVPADLDPAGLVHRAPSTSSTREALSESLGRAEQFIVEKIEAEEPGFKGGWLSSVAVEVALKEQRIAMSPNARSRMMAGLGYKLVGRAQKALPEEGLKRPSLWIKAEKYRDDLDTDEYCRAQHYASTAPLPHMMIAAQ